MKKFDLESNDVCKIFPLTFLIENLEKINCEDNIFQGFREHEKLILNEEHFNCNCQFESPYWLPEILLHNLSFPFLEIFSAYIVFMNKESDKNSNNQSFFHSINCLLTLTSQVLSLPDFKVPQYNAEPPRTSLVVTGQSRHQCRVLATGPITRKCAITPKSLAEVDDLAAVCRFLIRSSKIRFHPQFSSQLWPRRHPSRLSAHSSRSHMHGRPAPLSAG